MINKKSRVEYIGTVSPRYKDKWGEVVSVPYTIPEIEGHEFVNVVWANCRNSDEHVVNVNNLKEIE